MTRGCSIDYALHVSSVSDPSSAEEPVEHVVVTRTYEQLWRDAVWDRFDHKCSNCGSTHRLRLRMIVPLNAGGRYVVDNGIIHCRTCEMASNAVSSVHGSDKRPINFWVSSFVFQELEDQVEVSGKSKAAIVRYLIQEYVQDPSRFDDLEKILEGRTKTNDVKICGWVERAPYEMFQSLVKERGLSVTDALCALIQVRKKETSSDNKEAQ